MRQIMLNAYAVPAEVPTLPKGLVEIMEGLSRDVLKHNPPDLYKFCAEHMEKLLKIREECEHKPTGTSLEQKIAIAQFKVKRRAEQRRQKYDELLKRDNESTISNQDEENVDDIRREEPEIEKDLEQAIEAMSKATKSIEEHTSYELIEKPEEKYDENLIMDVKELNEITTPAYHNNENNSELKPDNLTSQLNENSPNYEDVAQNVEIERSKSIGYYDETEVEVNEVRDNHNINVIVTDESDINSTHIEEQHLEISQGINTENNIAEEAKIEPEQTIPNTANGEIEKKDNEVVDTNISDSVLITDQIQLNEQEGQSDLDHITKNENIEENYNQKPVLTTESTEQLPFVNEGEHKDVESTSNHSIEISKQVSEDEKNVMNEPEVKEDLSDGPEKLNNDISAERVEDDDNIISKREDSISSESVEKSAAPESDISEPNKVQESVHIAQEMNKSEEVVLPLDTRDDSQEHSKISVTDNNESMQEKTNDDSEESKEQESNDIYLKSLIESEMAKTGDASFIESIDKEVNKAEDPNYKESEKSPRMDLETAAVTIQKVFRNFLFKSRASTLDDISNEDVSLDATYIPDNISEENGNKDEFVSTNLKDRRPPGITRMDTVLQTVNEEKSLSLSTDDSSTLSSAATVIQAHVRGFLVRNRLHSNKTLSSNSFALSEEPSNSLEVDNGQQQNRNKTVLNIHIVPEGGHFISRDESMAMSLDLPLDNSPPSSATNLHPLGYDKSERRKQLKREDAIQSVSPPSNNSGKLSEEIDYVKQISNDKSSDSNKNDDLIEENKALENTSILSTSGETTPSKSVTAETVIEVTNNADDSENVHLTSKKEIANLPSDEHDVVTPFVDSEPESNEYSENKLLHSGEFHDLLVPTNVIRNDTSVVREFKNMYVYLLLWNNSTCA